MSNPPTNEPYPPNQPGSDPYPPNQPASAPYPPNQPGPAAYPAGQPTAAYPASQPGGAHPAGVPGASPYPASRADRGLGDVTRALKDPEFLVFVVVSLAVLIAAAVVDNGEDGQGFGADKAWLYVTLLAVGYMLSKGIAKAGGRSRHRSED